DLSQKRTQRRLAQVRLVQHGVAARARRGRLSDHLDERVLGQVEAAGRALHAGAQHELAERGPVLSLKTGAHDRPECDLLAVMSRSGLNAVERMAHEVLGAGARARGAGDLHREPAQYKSLEQTPEEIEVEA